MSTHPWIPNSSREVVEKMLKTIGIDRIEELFKDIPPEARINNEKWMNLEIGVGRTISEVEAKRLVDERLSKNKVFNPPPFMGAGVYPHYVPPLVKYILSRGEFLTAYTPYQAEISQGLMQAIFEYQSLMAELMQMELVNASMYDWASATAEALLMSVRVKKGRNKVIVPANMNPYHLKVVQTYLWPLGVRIEKTRYDPVEGTVDVEDLKNKVDANTAGVYLQYPNFFGIIENAKSIGEIAHEKGALYVTGVYPMALGLLKSPGEVGADIAVGDGQPFGLGLNYGGPYLGIFAVRYDQNLIRQMPGRIIGMTTTLDGTQRAFAMILQAREQHIKREKATSNICTNEALAAIGVAVYLSLLGKTGLRKLSELNYYRAHYAAIRFSEIGLKRIFNGDFFNEFAVSLNEARVKYETVHKSLLEKGVHGGLYLGELYPELGESSLWAFTELHFKSDIDRLIELLEGIVRGGE
ncbi:MAG: aminomethyl-transferring glycine dehydrogenase subunit GcvPA [Thermosphaera sp.]